MALVYTLTIVDGLGNQQNVPAIPSNLVRTEIGFSSSGDNTIVAGAAGTTIKIYRLRLQVAAATNIEFKDSSGTVFEGPYELGAGGAITMDLSTYAHIECGTAYNFIVNSSNAVQVTGAVLTLTS